MTKRELNLRIFKRKEAEVLFQPRIEWWYQYIMFLPARPLGDFKNFIRRIIDLFYPRLILGASDEVPPPADIERVKIVSQIVNHFNQKLHSRGQ